MSKELVCPFCNKKLEPIGTSGQFQCGTWGCDASFNFIATRDVWEYIERTSKTLEAELERTRKENEDTQAVLNCVVDMLKTLNRKYTLIMRKDVIKETVRLLEQTKGGDNE